MTGYLQRLVTTAVQGQTGVRPVVRPRESGRAEDPAAWTELGDDAWSSGAATATSSAAPEVADPRAHISDLPGPGASGTGGQPRAVPRTGPAPERASAPDPGHELLTPLFDARPSPARQAPAGATGLGSAARTPAGYRQQPGAAPEISWRTTPAQHAPAETDDPDPVPARPRQDPPAPPRIRRLPPLTGRAVPDRADRADSGDIEIHIGRIEVTAVTPPPAQPPVKAARKSINLGDYLRNGR